MSSKQMQGYVEEQILESYQSMYRLAYTYVKNEADALDVVQESVYKAIRNAAKLKHREYVQTWLFKIVMNTAISLLHAKNKETSMEIYVDEGKEDSYSDFDLMNSLHILNDKERAVIILRFFEDRKISEVADILDENINSVKTVLYRALKKLRIEMEEGGVIYEG